ncbi:spike base protein, RCAP_Rcc01079 family [Sphingobium xenophagum]|uniref:spike base protein, RCAP_Rcc01079 family n=1 Tax=Sphingobium xenophagum TaxID=121428 RepID=UPI00037C3323|nr:hypothetical protein [Sphingobium xenophagum]
MTDPYTSFIDNPIASARAPYAVVPHDSDALPVVPKALYIGTGGTVILRGVDGTADVNFLNVADGQVLDVRARYVRATGTTAANIVALA